MMGWTDRHCRAFHRCLTRHAQLYSEMIVADAVLFGERERLLGHRQDDGQVALQLGGSDPGKLAEAARIGEQWGYGEINLNCGCPSSRVRAGRIGACLMRDPATVAACVAAMRAAVSVPVTVKCRIGLDDDPPCLTGFVQRVADAGCGLFIVHARKAWLQGLNPKANREVPPLDYDLVARVKERHPEIMIVVNGGIGDLETARTQLARFDGVMIGRAAYRDPAMLGRIDAMFHGNEATVEPLAAAHAYRANMAQELAGGTPLRAMTRHMLGLFRGTAGARAIRRQLSEIGPRVGGAGALAVYDRALATITPPARRAA